MADLKEKTIKDSKIDKKQLKKLSRQLDQTEEKRQIKKFLIILLIVLVLVAGSYLFTRIFVTKDLFNKNAKEETQEVTFDYSKTILGSLLNRPYSDYYVLVYNSEDLQANYYANLVSAYSSKEKAIKIYTADLKDSMNAKYYANGEATNPKAKTVEDLKVGDLTLIKVSNKSIVKYIENTDSVKAELGL